MKAPNRKPLKILVVDDDGPNRQVMTALMEQCGHSCGIARDGTEALTLLHKEAFDVVLMDVDMPNMDGLEATRLLRMREARLNLKRVAVIAVTAHAQPRDRKRCLEAGMDGYLSKPVNPERICGIVEQVHQKHHSGPDSEAVQSRRESEEELI